MFLCAYYYHDNRTMNKSTLIGLHNSLSPLSWMEFSFWNCTGSNWTFFTCYTSRFWNNSSAVPNVHTPSSHVFEHSVFPYLSRPQPIKHLRNYPTARLRWMSDIFIWLCLHNKLLKFSLDNSYTYRESNKNEDSTCV